MNGDQLKSGFQKPRLLAVESHAATEGEATSPNPKWNLGEVGLPYKALLPRDLVLSMALLYLPKDGTDWPPLLLAAHKEMAKSRLTGDAADVPAKVALSAFESMGYQYMEVENGEWRGRLGSIAFKHWNMFRCGSEVSA